MSPLIQNIIVLSLVSLCVLYVGVQTFRTLFRGKSRVGSCCSKGCEGQSAPSTEEPVAVQMIPSQLLVKKR